ncbi:hypothetical protein ONZ45_g3433 [Pleurotus djamor]|nr:hypothetical protein ONZ45_g3433 [Pleurotus djamor]
MSVLLSERDKEEEQKEWIHEVVTQRCSTIPIRLYDTTSRGFITRGNLCEVVEDLTFRDLQIAFPIHQFTGVTPIVSLEIKRLVHSHTRFAILSHTWGSKELSYHNIRSGVQAIADDPKFVGFSHAAATFGCSYIWMDTACIDKSSSSELDESIRSMFTWYRNAYVCIVYLERRRFDDFVTDRWFKRGWTLQELLAPRKMVFYGRDWDRLFPPANNTSSHSFDVTRRFDMEGYRAFEPEIDVDLYEEDGDVPKATTYWLSSQNSPASRIAKVAVQGVCIEDMNAYKPSPSNARTMFEYMIQRNTTVPEDAAYCLLGLLGIVLPAAYGEGKEHALYRLQVACAERSNERNIFIWDAQFARPSQFNSMLPRDPFSPSHTNGTRMRVASVSISELWNNPPGQHACSHVDISFSFTNAGLRIPVILHNLEGDLETMVLPCATDDDSSTYNVAKCKIGVLGSYLGRNGHQEALTVLLEQTGPTETRQYRRVHRNAYGFAPMERLFSGTPEIVYII